MAWVTQGEILYAYFQDAMLRKNTKQSIQSYEKMKPFTLEIKTQETRGIWWGSEGTGPLVFPHTPGGLMSGFRVQASGLNASEFGQVPSHSETASLTSKLQMVLKASWSCDELK